MGSGTPPVVSPDWLAARLDAVRVVDVREKWEYESIGHLPGAVSIPFDSFRSSGAEDAGMLPGIDRFAEIMSEAGIANEDTIVAYDDEHGVFAARFVMTARLYGHEDAYLLDGDYSAWSRGHETTTDRVIVEPTDFVPTVPTDRPLIEASAVQSAVEDPNAVIVDTRSEEEFDTGHIETAVRLDWRELVDPDTRRLRPRDELLALLSERDIDPGKRVVLYCNTARRISHTYLALQHLGFPRVEFYEGSLTDWEARDLPLVSGSRDP